MTGGKHRNDRLLNIWVGQHWVGQHCVGQHCVGQHPVRSTPDLLGIEFPLQPVL